MEDLKYVFLLQEKAKDNEWCNGWLLWDYFSHNIKLSTELDCDKKRKN